MEEVLWATVQGADETRVAVNSDAPYRPYMWVSVGPGGFGVAFEGDSSFARRLADGASAWAEAMDAYEANQKQEGE